MPSGGFASAHRFLPAGWRIIWLQARQCGIPPAAKVIWEAFCSMQNANDRLRHGFFV
jgi:hypothetical protein